MVPGYRLWRAPGRKRETEPVQLGEPGVSHNPLPRMRPGFTLAATCPGAEVSEALRSRLSIQGSGIEGELSNRHAFLRVREADRRFWSPYLEITIDPGDEGGSRRDEPERTAQLRGTFSPKPEIWTGIVFSIGTLVVISTISLFFGVAQLVLGQTPWVWVVPFVALLLAVGIWTAGLVGQGLAADEMYRLRAFVDSCVEEAEARQKSPPITDEAGLP